MGFEAFLWLWGPDPPNGKMWIADFEADGCVPKKINKKKGTQNFPDSYWGEVKVRMQILNIEQGILNIELNIPCSIFAFGRIIINIEYRKKKHPGEPGC